MGLRALRKGVLPVLGFVFLLAAPGYSGVPEVRHIMVTDVTTRSFSVLWAASEPSVPDLDVFEDEGGTRPVAGMVITAHPIQSGDTAIRAASENQGVMMVRVTGLAPNTTYYFGTRTTSKSTSDTALVPASGPFPPVTTEDRTARTHDGAGRVSPFSNDVIIQECFMADGVTPASGTVLLATIEGARHPITAFVGDGIREAYAMIDLNNAFSLDTRATLALDGGRNLTLLNFRGAAGYSIVTHEVPVNNSLNEIKAAAFGLKPGWNLFSCPLEPDLKAVESVMEPIMDKLVAVWAHDASTGSWHHYEKAGLQFLNDLSEINRSAGYWVLMNEAASLTVHGQLNESGVPLVTGWNLVGPGSVATLSLMAATESIFDKLNAVWSYETSEDRWVGFDKSGPPSSEDLTWLKSGKAYWFNMAQDGVLE